MKFEELKLGMSASTTKAFTEKDVLSFAEVSTDNNPLHIDEEAAKNGMFGQRVVHGILVTGLISSVLGTKLPGAGAVYLGQEVKFRRPVFFNDEITAICELIELKEEKHIAIFKTICVNQHGVEVITGTATVMVK